MLVPLLLGFGIFFQAQPAIDPGLASRYFQEARWIAQDDNGKLWGKPLYGPMIFVDPSTREAVTNQPAPDPLFHADKDVFVGKLPADEPLANTAFDWKGSKWTMVLWPLPTNRAERSTLMMHELFHRIQGELGIPGASPQNAQMESLEGRVWLQLELRALAKALRSLAKEDIQDALLFRQMRYRKFPKAKAEEDSLELNEGLAEYTGYMLRGGWEPESRLWLANQLDQAISLPSYARRFPYWTGTAYAFLLDVQEHASDWRKNLTQASSLASMVATKGAVNIDLPDSQIVARAARYGYKDLFAAEKKREAEQRARVAEIKRKFIEGPVLVLPFEKMRISFDPRNVVPLGDDGVFYPTATIADAWGTIEVSGGILVAGNWRSARVLPPIGAEPRGDAWKLDLKDGWKLVPGERKGDFTLSNK